MSCFHFVLTSNQREKRKLMSYYNCHVYWNPLDGKLSGMEFDFVRSVKSFVRKLFLELKKKFNVGKIVKSVIGYRF